MPFSVGERVRLNAALELAGVRYEAGARGTVESVDARGAGLRVRMNATGAVVRVRASDVVADQPRVVRSRTRDWVVAGPAPAAVALRGGGGAGAGADEPADIPDFIVGDRFEVVERVVAREAPRATGLRAAAPLPPPPLQLEVTAQSGEAYVAVARHASGALTFHLPEPNGLQPARGGGGSGEVGGAAGPAGEPRRGRRRPTTLVFSIDAGPAVPDAAAPAGAAAVRGIVGRIIKVVVMKVVGFVAGQAVDFLGRKLEERLWQKAGRAEGWVRVVPGAPAGDGAAAALLTGRDGQPTAPPAAGGRALLCIHGTFSNTLSAFKDLLRGQTLADLRAIYGDRIYGFEHFTISKSPAENVAQMLGALPAGDSGRITFDVVTHSRGGLVLRTLLREVARQGAAGRLRLGRVVLVAAPNLGTPLATARRWEDTLGWFANVIDLFPDNPFTTGAGWVAEALSWLAQNVVGRLPGLSAMDVDGDVVSSLRAAAALPAGAEWYALAANYEPDDARLLQRLADMGVDAFFGMPNDLVVPTVGGWHLGDDPAAAVPPDRVGCFGAGGNLAPGQPGLVTHVSFFARPETHDFVLNALRGRPLGLAPISSLPQRRGGVGVAAPAGGALDVRVTVPPAPAAAVAAATAAAARAAADAEDWNRQDSLHLIVLPAPEEAAPAPAVQAGPSSPRASRPRKQEAQMLATYGGASVLAPFRLRGPEDDAGRRWNRIIAGHHDINAFVEGAREAELSPADVEELGGLMFETLFRDDVRRLYDQARFRHVRRKLNVIFTSMVPWVAELPWEFAFDVGCRAFLGTSDVRFVRGVLTPVPADNIPVREGEPLRILVVSAQPRSAAALSLAQERALIESAFRPLIDRGAVRIEVLPEATPDDLHARVRRGDGCGGEFDVVHFMGHGRFDEETETGYLIFEDGKRNVQELSTSHVKDILRSRGVKLVFLNACQTGRGSRADYNKGVAPGLVADGVPAVVANQYSVLDRSATTFARHFYWCLAQGLPLGDAAREARIALNYSGGGLIGWAVPVLFARNADAVLCRAVMRDDAQAPAAAAAAAAASPAPGAGTIAPRGDAADTRAPAGTASRAGEVPPPDAPPGISAVTFPGGPAPGRRLIGVAVWDVNDAVPELDRVVGQMNAAQPLIEFRVATLTAPYGLWRVDAARFGTAAYLPAERTARRLEKLRSVTRADYLLCVTDLPLADERTANLYLWFGDDNPSPGRADNRVIIFSTWGFDPLMRGESLQRALVNVAVQALAGLLADDAPLDNRRGTIGYFNPNREVEQITDRLRIGDRNRPRLSAALRARGLPEGLLGALDALLELFQPPDGDGAGGDGAAAAPTPGVPKRKGRAGGGPAKVNGKRANAGRRGRGRPRTRAS